MLQKKSVRMKMVKLYIEYAYVCGVLCFAAVTLSSNGGLFKNFICPFVLFFVFLLYFFFFFFFFGGGGLNAYA